MESAFDHERFHLVRLLESREEIGQLEDGYWYYFPKGSGAIPAETLRAIADVLDRHNAEWDAQVRRDLGIDGNHPNC